jgi:3-methyladenine DNA glycosylase AlkC
VEPFRNLLDAALVRHAGRALAQAWPRFDRARFEKVALDGLDGLEMKARAMRIADALEATLPPAFDEACGVIEAALGAPVDLDAPVRDAADPGIGGWMIWPLGEFVARRGIDDPERALATLHALTQRFSAEFALRPFIVRHPALAMATVARWARDPSAQVRRLASEGSRPRLPWGLRLHALVADPTPMLPILETLQDDPSPAVRRSVANHLNDIAKDHPAVVVAWVERHLPHATPQRRALLAHACRTLVKQGHAGVLALWGVGAAFDGDATLKAAPRRVRVGGSVTLTIDLRSRSAAPQALVVDYVVHHVKADGRTTPKVFKGWKLTLAPGECRTLVKRHSFAPITTRRYHAGEHAIDVQVNGAARARAHLRLSV